MSNDKYLIGSEDKLELSMNITNDGEDAYEATLYVAMPKHVSYIKTEMIGTIPKPLNWSQFYARPRHWKIILYSSVSWVIL